MRIVRFLHQLRGLSMSGEVLRLMDIEVRAFSEDLERCFKYRSNLTDLYQIVKHLTDLRIALSRHIRRLERGEV